MRIETMFDVTYTLGLPEGMVQPDALGHHRVIIDGEWSTTKMEAEELTIRRIVQNVVGAFLKSFSMKPTFTRIILTYSEWIWWIASDEGVDFLAATLKFPAKDRKRLVANFLEVDEVLYTE